MHRQLSIFFNYSSIVLSSWHYRFAWLKIIKRSFIEKAQATLQRRQGWSSNAKTDNFVDSLYTGFEATPFFLTPTPFV